MKGTEKIIAHISADAQSEVDAIIAEAKSQCAEIQANYANKAKARFEEKMAAGKKLISESADGHKRIAQMESKKEVLALKQEMVSKVFDAAAEKLVNLPDAEYEKFLTGLVVKSAVSGDELVIFNKRDKEKFAQTVLKNANEQLNGNLKAAEESGDFAGGVIVKRGAITVNNTIELLIDLKKSEMSLELAKLLFE